jgi:hypothetical protein
VYHVLNRENARLPIFDKPGDYQAFEPGQGQDKGPGQGVRNLCLYWFLTPFPLAGIFFESDKPSYIQYDLGLLPLDEEKPLPSPGYWDKFKMKHGSVLALYYGTVSHAD